MEVTIAKYHPNTMLSWTSIKSHRLIERSHYLHRQTDYVLSVIETKKSKFNNSLYSNQKYWRIMTTNMNYFGKSGLDCRPKYNFIFSYFFQKKAWTSPSVMSNLRTSFASHSQQGEEKCARLKIIANRISRVTPFWPTHVEHQKAMHFTTYTNVH